MEHEAMLTADEQLHRSHVERSMRELQRMVADSEDALAEVGLRSRAVPLPRSAATSLAVMKAGYDRATVSEPFLPYVDSVLPALLALRKTHEVAAESWAHVTAQEEPQLAAARRQLAAEQTRLDDQKALNRALEGRLAALRSSQEARQQSPANTETTAEQRRQQKLEALKAQRHGYDTATSTLLRALRGFIHERLGPMLAAEELGGPVVGAMVDVRADDLVAGFSAQGKPRRQRQPGGEKGAKSAKSAAAGSRDAKRQQRIDEIWGPRANDRDGGEKEDSDDDDANEKDNRDESATAGAEMQDLTEQLLNTLASAAGDGSAAYVTLPRESAAARFLVRSKVAQFHPRDATRLRLIDFGRELDD
ncbi:hypothetical protein CMQ_1223 [Grosmannia clavigera kw1407]|uniref:Kinetochore protein n=1 Tax=Grosmannia clavigera (strain kw1407 / UAMH 11150) TaxID=655863 RepID=F0XDJ3_GROCL|nr:uncharacterized protein CMQ_1223 [Grosmannia clavigera kw1407]EFX04295.1 hypothetical protein CMQ_1223 [Grosmannia clavigera kw1407]